MLEIAVCDDDMADLERAVTMLHKIFTSQQIAYHIEQFVSANQMLENISNIDIGILDISMEELNGIKLGRKLKEKFPDVKLVYITSYEEYCMQVMYPILHLLLKLFRNFSGTFNCTIRQLIQKFQYLQFQFIIFQWFT